MALTATNAYGNNTNTKTNYITVSGTTTVIVYADTYTFPLDNPRPNLVSGTLSSLQQDDSNYLAFQCNTTTQKYGVKYTATTGYVPSQVSQMTIVYQAKCDRTDTPRLLAMNVLKADGSMEFEANMYPGTTDTNYSWNTTNVSNYMSSGGVVGLVTCGCPPPATRTTTPSRPTSCSSNCS